MVTQDIAYGKPGNHKRGQSSHTAAWMVNHKAHQSAHGLITAALADWSQTMEAEGKRSIPRASADACYRVLSFIASVGDCWMRVDTMAERLGKAPRTVRFALSILRRSGLISRRSRYKAGRQRPSMTKAVLTVQRALFNRAFSKPKQTGRAGHTVSLKENTKKQTTQKPPKSVARVTQTPQPGTVAYKLEQLRQAHRETKYSKHTGNRLGFAGEVRGLLG